MRPNSLSWYFGTWTLDPYGFFQAGDPLAKAEDSRAQDIWLFPQVGCLFLGVLTIRSLPTGVYVGAPEFWTLPFGLGTVPATAPSTLPLRVQVLKYEVYTLNHNYSSAFLIQKPDILHTWILWTLWVHEFLLISYHGFSVGDLILPDETEFARAILAASHALRSTLRVGRLHEFWP